MKSERWKRCLAGVLCLALLLGTGAQAAFSERSICAGSIDIARGTKLTEEIHYKSGDRVTEHYIEYTPNNDVQPIVVYGSKVCNYGNFETMAALLEKRGYVVVGGINGDYYDTATYQPLGIVITDGLLKSSDAGHYAVGFMADGTAIMGSPALEMTLTVDGVEYKLSGFNKTRTDSGLYLYSEDFSSTTGTSSGGTEIVFDFTGDITVNCELELFAESISKSSGAVQLPEGKLVLSVSDNAPQSSKNIIDAIDKGTEAELVIRCEDDRWDDVENAVGSLYKLVTDGKVESGLDDSTNAPRTAVGITEDGDIILYTVDGRQSGYSTGATMNALAERMLALGCVEATIMDGGGSTNMNALYPGRSSLSQVNSQSSGNRSVTNYIMLVAEQGRQSAAETAGITPYNAVVCSGSTLQLTAGASDKYGNPVDGSVTWNIESGSGNIDSNGLFTAGSSGETIISAQIGDAETETKVLVVDKVSELTLTSGGSEVSRLSVNVGESVELDVSAVYDYLDVNISESACTWTVKGDIGSVEDGTFTAGSSAATGSIEVAYGDLKVTVQVSVKQEITLLDNFEGQLRWTGAELCTDKDHVRFGDQSMKLTSSSTAFSRTALQVPKYLGVWVYGDNSGGVLSAVLSDNSTLNIGTIDFEGWKWMTVQTGKTVSGLTLSSGTVWIDQITASPSDKLDEAAPIVEAQLLGTSLTGTITDTADDTVRSQDIVVSYDGQSVSFTYDEVSGELSATVPERDGKMHRISIYAADRSGNISRSSATIEGEEMSSVFEDAKGHWAEKEIGYLYDMGLINGISETSYAPDVSMTREQFATVIARYLGIDLTEYESVSLDFADVDSIQGYAMSAVKAVYSLGIIKGVPAGDEVYFQPSEPISRAQAMTIIGRTLALGYEQAEMNFTDSADVPDWAQKYMSTLITMGVVSGYEDGSLKPNAVVTRAQVAKMMALVY